MRDLDSKELLTGDFLCVYGDVISNVPLEAALAAHRARRLANKNAVMTMVLREAGTQHRTKAQSTKPVFVIDPLKDRCLHYEQMRPRQRSPKLDLEPSILEDNVELEVRQDLIDCGIDICTPQVLVQWSEGFDWEMPRRGFLYGILKDHELNGLTIHTHIVKDHYAARVKNLQAYDAVSKDIISRWAYPLCPDSNLLEKQSYHLLKGNIYRENGVALARSSTVGRKTVLGAAASVGEQSEITNSVVGRRCVIGKRVKIDGAYIWDDARIGDDTTIQNAIVANEASIGKGCKILPGALISYGVRIADGTVVQGTSRITKLKRKRGYEQDEIIRSESDPKVVGDGGEGFELAESDNEEDEEAEGLTSTKTSKHLLAAHLSFADVYLVYNLADLSLSAESISTLNSEEEDEDFVQHQETSRANSFVSVGSEDSGTGQHHASDFHHEAASGIFDALEKNEDPANMQLELKGLTLSSNAEGKQVRRAVAVAFMKRIASLVEGGSTAQQAATKVIPPNKLLIEKCVLDHQQAQKTEQVEFLLFMQTDLVHRKQGDKILLFVCYALATNDLVEAEGFEQWWNDERSTASEELKNVRADTKKLVDTLLEESEEEEEDDDDE